MSRLRLHALACLALLACAAVALGQPDEATSQQQRNGEEKSRIDKRCYYGVDGKLQKVAVAATLDAQSEITKVTITNAGTAAPTAVEPGQLP